MDNKRTGAYQELNLEYFAPFEYADLWLDVSKAFLIEVYNLTDLCEV